MRMNAQRGGSRLDALAALSVIVASASVTALVANIYFRSGNRPPRERPAAPKLALPADPIELRGAAMKGNTGARAGVVEYSDFECPYCGEFTRQTLPAVVEKYVDTGKAFIAFRHFPLNAIHRSAQRAAEVAECGRRQGRFWAVHDALFARPRQLPPLDDLTDLARLTGVDAKSFKECLETDAGKIVEDDLIQARALGINSTPTFLFGVLTSDGRFRVTRREAGAMPISAFGAALDEAIGQVSRMADRGTVGGPTPVR